MKSYSIESLQKEVMYYPHVQDLLDNRFIVLDLISGKERELKHIKTNPNKIVEFNVNARKPSIIQELFTVATIVAYDIEERRIIEGLIYIPEDMKYVTLYLDEIELWYKKKQLRILDCSI